MPHAGDNRRRPRFVAPHVERAVLQARRQRQKSARRVCSAAFAGAVRKEVRVAMQPSGMRVCR